VYKLAVILALELKDPGKRACSKIIIIIIIIIIRYRVLKTVIPTDPLLLSEMHFISGYIFHLFSKTKLRFCKTNCGFLQML
jgi:uncharacterized membrane protein YobD (UPF0266 family)